MRFLANENFPLTSVRRLRAAGQDAFVIAEELPGATDAEVLARAASESLILLTFDRDYGELIYRLGLPAPAGVIYFRFSPLTPIEPAEHLPRLLAVSRIVLAGKFTVVERGQVRQRPLP
jgi:predicted nuclease of predicted toxin-antitoxin system